MSVNNVKVNKSEKNKTRIGIGHNAIKQKGYAPINLLDILVFAAFIMHSLSNSSVPTHRFS